MPKLYEQIGQQIRKLRGSLSQDALASELGVGANTVSRWETGTYKPTPEDLDKLARFFKVPITTFFPHLESGEDTRIAALTSATGGLNKEDFDEVLKYAEFRKVRRLMEGVKAKRTKTH